MTDQDEVIHIRTALDCVAEEVGADGGTYRSSQHDVNSAVVKLIAFSFSAFWVMECFPGGRPSTLWSRRGFPTTTLPLSHSLAPLPSV